VPKHLYQRFAIVGLDIEVKRVKYDRIEHYELAKCLTTSGAEAAKGGWLHVGQLVHRLRNSG
jgi:hypothetical protein